MKPLLHRAVSRTLLIAALSSYAACSSVDRITPPAQEGGQASFDGKVGDAGNSAKHGLILSRVLLDKAGTGTLEVRTGTFDNALGVGLPNGYLAGLQYKVYGATGKQLTSQSVQLTGKPTTYSKSLGAFDPSWYVIVQANVRAAGGDVTRNDVVRDSADTFYNPDLDVRAENAVKMGFGTNPQNPDFFAASENVKAATPTWFEVRFSNTGPGGVSILGASVACSVRVFAVNADGTTGSEVGSATTPYKWETVGGVQDATPASATWSSSTALWVAPNERPLCRFNLSLAGVGTTKRIVVTAIVLSPTDYDPSNNSVTADFHVVDFTPVGQDNDGSAVGQAEEIALYNGTPSNVGSLAGVVQQGVTVRGLKAFVVSDQLQTGTFTLRVGMGTAPAQAGGAIDLGSVTPMVDAIWTARVSDLFARRGSCFQSDNAATLSFNLALAVNGASATNEICVDEIDGGLLRLTVKFYSQATPTAAPAAVALQKYLRFDVRLSFSESADVLGGTANMRLVSVYDDNFQRQICDALGNCTKPPVIRSTSALQ